MLRVRRSEASHNAVRYGSCDASLCPEEASLGCLVCGTALTDSRAKFCSPAHKQIAYRQRRQAQVTPDEPEVRRRLQRPRRLMAHTLYECPSCLRFVSSKSTSTKDDEGRGAREEGTALDN